MAEKLKTGIGFSLYGGVRKRWGEECYKKLKAAGFSCIDFNMCSTETELYTLPFEEVKEILAKEKELMDAAGIEFWQMHGPWRWPCKDYTEGDREERMEKCKRSIEVAAFFGCKYWVIHPIMPFYVDDIGTADEPKTWDYNIEFMTELLKFAKQYNVTICLENMPFTNFSLSKPCDILRFVKTINDQKFKICLDTGHISVFGSDLSLYDEIKRLGSEIKVLHVHDNKCIGDEHLLPFLGSIDWQKVCLALNEIGFDGVLSLETAPPMALNDDNFEKMYSVYAGCAKQLANDIEQG